MLEHLFDNIDIFICPECRNNIKIESRNIKCVSCNRFYEVENGIPNFFILKSCNNVLKNDITEKIKNFYEKTPFPNYEDFEDVSTLIQKAKKSFFADLLDQQIPFNSRVLEVGCGTGQLSNFLGISNRVIFGTDMCLNSLKLGQNFKTKNNLKRVGFYQMNLFKPIFKEESFDIVICNGVLHHTSNPLLGFKTIAQLVKKDGYIIIGLYNKYGRFFNDVRSFIFKMSNDFFKFLDYRLRNKDINEIRKLTWFLDQYKNPHESKHAIKEVLEWFNKNGFEFINSIPKSEFFAEIGENEKLFKTNSQGNFLDHFLVQLKMLFSKNNEGGFFIMIGKKR